MLPIPSSTSFSTSPSTIAVTTPGAPEMPSPISSLPTGPCATLPVTTRSTTFSLSTRRSAKISASPCSTKTIANLLPPACSPISKSCCPNSTPIPSKSASTAAAIPCSWPFPASSRQIVSPPRNPWTASSSATPIPVAPNPSPANPSASPNPPPNGPPKSSPAIPPQQNSRKRPYPRRLPSPVISLFRYLITSSLCLCASVANLPVMSNFDQNRRTHV